MKEQKDKEIKKEVVGTNLNMEKVIGYLAAHRRVILNGEITTESTTAVGKMLMQLDYDSSQPITLIISSKGGSVAAGYHLYDVINMLNSPVDGLVLDNAGSMAVDVLQMCRRRLALPHATIFCHFLRYHFVCISDSDKIFDSDTWSFRRGLLVRKKEREQLYAKRMGCSVKEVQAMFRLGEMYAVNFYADEALERGLIDEIVYDFKLLPQKAN